MNIYKDTIDKREYALKLVRANNGLKLKYGTDLVVVNKYTGEVVDGGFLICFYDDGSIEFYNDVNRNLGFPLNSYGQIKEG